MNKTVNINLAGIFFHIDEDAYLKLQHYLEAIKRSFTDSQGRSEIIADIEARISELFTERVAHDKQVIGLKEVDEIISIMGQPEDYLVDDEIFEDGPSTPYQRKASSKKLFRDTDNSYIGGVSAGLAHYFGIDAIWVRLAWIILIFGAGTGILLYILLWILVPEAKTTAEKIMMMGDPVTISNIEKKIKDGFENVSDTVTDVAKNVSVTVTDAAKNVSDSVSNATKSIDFGKPKRKIKSTSKSFFDTVGDIFMFLFKVFAKLIGVLLIIIGASALIALCIGLLSLGVTDIIHIPGLDLVEIANAGDTPIWLISLMAFFMVAIPFFFLFYLGLKILVNNLKSIGNIAKFTLLGIWLLSIIGLAIAGIRQATEHAFDERVVERLQLDVSANDTLNLKMVGDDRFQRSIFRSDGNFKMLYNKNGEKAIYSSDIAIIVKSTTDSLASLVIDKSADGRSYEKAIERAKNINYGFELKDNTLLLDAYLTTNPKHKFSDQEVILTLHLPEGAVIKCHENSSSFFYGKNYHGTLVSYKDSNHYLKILENDSECLDCPLEDKDPEVRKQALEKLKNQSDIFDVAKNDEDAEIRKMAVSKMTHQHNLSHIAKNDEDAEVRMAALKKVSSQHSITTVAKNDEDAQVRKLAINKVTDQHNLAEIAKKDKDPELRKLALGKLTNQYTIAEIAKNDENAEVRKMAISKVIDQHHLTQIAKKDEDPELRKLALGKLINQHSIAEIAKNDKNVEVREIAINKVIGQHNLTDIAKKDADPELRKLALGKLTSQHSIAEIAKNDENAEVRKMAVGKLTLKNKLKEIAENDPDDEVRKLALKKQNE